tara:strand:+ start:1784 stop:2272 length:489 start_codon:yes stop_codon:yes gene_type:complete
MFKNSQNLILLIGLLSLPFHVSWAEEVGLEKTVLADPNTSPFHKSIAQKSDQELNIILATKWDDLDPYQRGAVLSEVKSRMARQTGAPRELIKLQAHHRYGERVIRKADGSVVRIKTRVVSVKPVSANRKPYGVGFEERLKKKQTPTTKVSSPIISITDSSP